MNKLNKNIFVIFSMISMVCSLLYPLTIKAASFQARISTDGVRLRLYPTTKNSDQLDTLNTNYPITVLDDTKLSGEGCGDGWYKVSYNGEEGYVCSKYVTTQIVEDGLGRPWNTPKKAIMGGAKFIAQGYIDKGQYTSYLKKFNVNPDAYYDVYNHQYQTNIAAPFTEAAKSSKAYINTGSMDLPFHFTIPVFDNMAESYLNPTGYRANLTTTEETDSTFEEMIKDFPDSYKPYLRELHKEHSAWTFTAMQTHLDFATSVNVEKSVGAIQGSKSLMELDAAGNAQSSGESGWYLPNFAATAYYMDPRNFLNETYVFMFEDLSYNENITEAPVKQVLGTKPILSEYDLIDNQSYASIFIEAGKAANVNPVYLASLSAVEISQANISGDEFIYNDITYSGLFNFFNIGASSSASNPLRAGLVYASGGLCTNCSSYVPGEAPSSSNTFDKNAVINSIGASVTGSYIKGFSIGESIANLQSKSSSVSYSGDGIIKTGMTITLADGTSYTAVIYGDLSGDGKINSADLLKLRQHLLGTSILNGAYLEAAKVNGNDNINSANLLRVRQHLLGTNSINQ